MHRSRIRRWSPARLRRSPAHDVRTGREIGEIIVIEDVTALVTWRERALLNERLSTMGQVAAQVAHEIRNPLGAIELFASANAGAPDPDDYFFRTFRTGGSANVFKFSDAQIDSLLDRARSTMDPAARKEAYDQVQKKLACTGPIAHLAYSTLFSAARDKVNGYEIMPNRSLSALRNTTLAP